MILLFYDSHIQFIFMPLRRAGCARVLGNLPEPFGLQNFRRMGQVWFKLRYCDIGVICIIYFSLTGETEEGVAISEICKLDPAFIKVRTG